MKDMIQQFLKHEMDLPSPPAIAVRILEEIKKDECSLDSLSRIIESDPALVTKILKVSNSPHYGMVAEVNTLQRALSVLGLNAVKNIVLSFVLTDMISGAEDSPFDYDFFWRRSVTAAVSAELVCKLIGAPNGDIFITSLLQDVGMVFMYVCRQDDYLKVLEEARIDPSCKEDIETGYFGFDHQALGSVVLRDWGLPENICVPIGFHHSPQQAPSVHQSASWILNIADSLSLIYHGNHSAEAINKLKDTFSKHCDIAAEPVDELIDSVAERTIELLSFFDIQPGDMKPYSQILQDANAELGKLNLTYEQLLLQYKTAMESAEKLARELQKANHKLNKLATTDGLTGLYNHRAFQDLLGKRVREANRHGRSLALILIDLDHFKRINDRFGHPTGDAVLKAVSSKIAKTLRKEDILARYGGEEFAVILPETEIKGAMQLAHRIRTAIAKLVITIDGVSLNVTVSLGLSANHHQQGDSDKAALIDASDKALYMAKNAGRNTLRVSLLNAASTEGPVKECTSR